MSENIIPTNGHEELNPKPKRRIVRRIVRRVPKRKEPTEEVVEPKENPFYSSLNAGGGIRKGHVGSLENVLANEESVYSGNIELAPEVKDKEISDPKEMILKQLSQKNKEPVKNTSDTKNPISNIWPYIAASKQSVKSETNFSEDEDSGESYENEKKYFSWIPWVIIPLIVTGIVIFGLSYFAGAEVIVTPKVQTVAISTDLSAEKDVEQSKLMPLAVLIIEDSVTSEAQASESKTTIATAAGKVTIYNKQKVAQTLIKTTRLEAADGKIYRIRENIKIPAAVGDKPGTFNVMVYAESAGPDYNKKTGTDFNVPGFKGKPQFDLVYAKSITDIGGGSSGVKKSVSKDAMEELAKGMRIELENKLRGRVSRELLHNQVAYEGLYQFDYKDPTLEASDAPEKAKVALSGSLSVPVFDKAILGRELAKSSVKDYAGEEINLNKIELLAVKIAGDQKVNLLTEKKITFHFEGEGKFIWTVDVAAFTKALLNVSKNDVSRVATRFTGIDKVTATLNPFWKNYFPGNIGDIKVKILEQTN